MLLKDKIVIVSGIGPGLGIELALLAAKEGAHCRIRGQTFFIRDFRREDG